MSDRATSWDASTYENRQASNNQQLPDGAGVVAVPERLQAAGDEHVGDDAKTEQVRGGAGPVALGASVLRSVICQVSKKSIITKNCKCVSTNILFISW